MNRLFGDNIQKLKIEKTETRFSDINRTMLLKCVFLTEFQSLEQKQILKFELKLENNEVRSYVVRREL